MSTNPSASPAVTEPAVTAVPTTAVATIEADDPAVLDNDSINGDTASLAGSTESLNSGIFKYRRENGRTYHALKDGDYFMPNDEEEQDRLDLQNHVFLLVNNGKLFTAPVDNPARVLDVGTGTGIWAIDFADQYPGSHVIGNDLSPIQPGFVPPNLQFEVDDVSAEWLHKPFNFIHVRILGASLLSYKDMLASAYQNLAPGGWIECVEFEGIVRSLHEDPEGTIDSETYSLDIAPYCKKFQAGCNEASIKAGRKLNVAPYIKDWLAEVGFENVVEKITMTPIGTWPKNRRQKEIGLYQHQNYLTGLDSYGLSLFTRVLGWTGEEYTVLKAQVVEELKDPNMRFYSILRQVYAQKTEVPAAETAEV